MAQTHSSTNLTYFSVGGDIEIPFPFNFDSAAGIQFFIQNGWQAEWRGNNFFHTPVAGQPGHESGIINYTTWDGRNWQAQWEENGNEGYFIHTRNGVSHKDRVINYLDWRGNLWSATRKNEHEFQHVFFAEAQIRRSFLDEIVDWVVDHWQEIAIKIIEFVTKKKEEDGGEAVIVKFDNGLFKEEMMNKHALNIAHFDEANLKWGSTVAKD